MTFKVGDVVKVRDSMRERWEINLDLPADYFIVGEIGEDQSYNVGDAKEWVRIKVRDQKIFEVLFKLGKHVDKLNLRRAFLSKGVDFTDRFSVYWFEKVYEDNS